MSMYDFKRRVTKHKAKNDKPRRKFGIHSLPGDAIKKAIWEELDFSACNAALLDKVPTVNKYWEVKEEINEVIESHIYAAFWLGWQAAQHPEEWLFSAKDTNGGLSYVTPDNTFVGKMSALGYGSEEIWDTLTKLDEDLAEIFMTLMSTAENKAFGLGWQSQADPSWLIFWREEEDK